MSRANASPWSTGDIAWKSVAPSCHGWVSDPDFPSKAEGTFRLLLSHTPDNIERAVAQDVDLVLAGHNHGGQVCLPLIGPVYSPSRLRCPIRQWRVSARRNVDDCQPGPLGTTPDEIPLPTGIDPRCPAGRVNTGPTGTLAWSTREGCHPATLQLTSPVGQDTRPIRHQHTTPTGDAPDGLRESLWSSRRRPPRRHRGTGTRPGRRRRGPGTRQGLLPDHPPYRDRHHPHRLRRRARPGWHFADHHGWPRPGTADCR